MPARGGRSARARSMARKFTMQALYQWLLTGQDVGELAAQFAEDEFYGDADAEYFLALLRGVVEDAARLDGELAGLVDRPVAQLDPVEHAVLLLGLRELERHPEVPYRVAISEGVELAKRFGATEGHKFVNAVLDRAARRLRAAEIAAAQRAVSG